MFLFKLGPNPKTNILTSEFGTAHIVIAHWSKLGQVKGCAPI